MKKLVITSVALIFTTVASAQSSNCIVMANMAKDLANLRDMGVPLSAIEAILIRDVPDDRERALGIVAANFVYSGRHKGAALKREILKNAINKIYASMSLQEFLKNYSIILVILNNDLGRLEITPKPACLR